MPDDIALLPATELIEAYIRGSLSPVDVTRACLERVERDNPRLNAMVLVDAEGALAAAAESERRWADGKPLGPVDGVPTTVKDLLLTRGWPTLRGSGAVDPDQPWDEDAPSVARLRAAGAVLIGKTATPEMGWKGVTDSALTGITRNPWNPDLTPGGSSGGAAVAAATGMAALNLGTDGGGSIRIPAAFTGIYGLKPSFGRVPAWPPSPFGTLAHVGPMTRTVGDAALMMQVIAQPDPRDWSAAPHIPENFLDALQGGVAGLRIGFSETFGGRAVDSELASLVFAAAATFEELGARVEPVDPPLDEAAAIFLTHWTVGAATLLAALPPDRLDSVDPGLRALAESGAAVPLLDYTAAQAARARLGAAMNRFHQEWDLLLTPVLPLTAFAAGHEVPPGGPYASWVDWTPFTYPFNLTQQPAASVPCGLTKAGLPVALQIVGPQHRDDLVLRASRAFEKARPWRMPRPAAATVVPPDEEGSAKPAATAVTTEEDEPAEPAATVVATQEDEPADPAATPEDDDAAR